MQSELYEPQVPALLLKRTVLCFDCATSFADADSYNSWFGGLTCGGGVYVYFCVFGAPCPITRIGGFFVVTLRGLLRFVAGLCIVLRCELAFCLPFRFFLFFHSYT